MRRGKISENVLKRSVLKNINNNREEVINGADVGADCAVLSYGDGYDIALSVTPVIAPIEDICSYAIPMALNNIAAAGAQPVSVMLSILLPDKTEEVQLQQMMKQAQEICSKSGVDIIGGHTEVTAGIEEPIMTVSGIGKQSAEGVGFMHAAGPDQDIVISKWIGLEGTVRLARERREELCTRYPMRMIDEAAAYDKYLSVIPEAATAMKSGVCAMHDVSRGGVFGALWELAQRAGVGLEIDLKKIPVKQETIEICEFYGLNPYELLSGGCLMMVTEDGEALIEALAHDNIPAVVVGRTTEGNARVIYNEDEKRYLDRPKTDQIYCISEQVKDSIVQNEKI